MCSIPAHVGSLILLIAVLRIAAFIIRCAVILKFEGPARPRNHVIVGIGIGSLKAATDGADSGPVG